MIWTLEQPKDISLITISGSLNISPFYKIWEGEICKSCQRPIKITQINNLTIDIYGNKTEGFVWIDDAQMIVDEELYQKIIDSGMRGVSFRQVEIITWFQIDSVNNKMQEANTSIFPKLFQIIPEKKENIFIKTKEPKVKEKCQNCNLIIYEPPNGIFINEKLLDGDDVFVTSELPGIILLSDKFINLLLSSKIINYQLINAINYNVF